MPKRNKWGKGNQPAADKKIPPSKLYAALLVHPALPRQWRRRDLEPDKPETTEYGELCAILVGVAYEESRLQINAFNSKEDSIGLWQVHKQHAEANASIKADLSVDNQILQIEPIVRSTGQGVSKAYLSRDAQELPHPTGEMVATWFQVAWQYGPVAMRNWVEGSTNHTIDGFITYRREHGLGLADTEERTRSRAKGVVTMYRRMMKREAPDPEEEPEGVAEGAWSWLMDKLGDVSAAQGAAFGIAAVVAVTFLGGEAD